MRAALALGGMFLVTAYAVAMFAPAAGIFHDDGIYIVTARALAEGEGYRIISLPESPPQTKYPILFPWLLSLVWRLAPSFPDNLPLLRLVPVASTVAWLWLSWRLLLTAAAPRAATTAIVALTAASPWVVFLGTALLSETLFAALLTGSLLLLTKVQHEGTAPLSRVCAVAGLLAGACFLTRTAGIAVVLAGFAWLFVQRRRAGAIAFGMGAAALVVPWIAWVLSNAGADADSYYSSANYGSWNVVFHYAWPEKLAVVARNGVYSIFAPFGLWGINVNPWLVIPFALLAACVCRGIWLTRMHPITWCVIVYTGIIMMWVWPPVRFLVPMLPVLLWHVFVAIRRVPAVAATVVVMVLLATSFATLFEAVAHAHNKGLMWARAESAEDWHQLSALLDWIRRETPPDAVLTGNLDPAYFLYTGRKAVRAFVADPYALFYSNNRLTAEALGSVSEFRRRLLAAGVDYCVWSPAPSFGETPHFRRLLDQLSRDVPGSLTIATGDMAAGYVVYRVDRTRLADAERGILPANAYTRN